MTACRTLFLLAMHYCQDSLFLYISYCTSPLAGLSFCQLDTTARTPSFCQLHSELYTTDRIHSLLWYLVRTLWYLVPFNLIMILLAMQKKRCRLQIRRSGGGEGGNGRGKALVAGTDGEKKERECWDIL
jgi:hypothetical protein